MSLQDYRAEGSSDDGLVDKKKKPFYYYIWDTFGKPPAGASFLYLWRGLADASIERRLLMKLDCSLLIFSVLGLICRYIDQTNLSTACKLHCFRKSTTILTDTCAVVSGMK